MNRPELKSVSIAPSPANARAVLAVTLGVEDVEIIFSTDHKYAGPPGKEEVYAGEEGII